MAVGAIHNFIRDIVNLPLELNHTRFYRGQGDVTWELESSIFRSSNKKIKENEVRIINEIKAEYPEVFGKCLNSFEYLVNAQHFDIPTRLLDITTNPLVALYFACSRESYIKGNAAVYVFDVPNKIIKYYDDNEVNNIINGILQSETNNYTPLFIKPRNNNQRLIRQEGAFILLDNLVYNKNLCKVIEIANNGTRRILQDLRKLGICKERLFPEVSNYINRWNN